VPSLFRTKVECNYQRERVETLDNDFFDVDWIRDGNESLVVLAHGLEGSAGQHYIRSQAAYFSERSFDIAAINFRSCSGEMNKTTRLYHTGDTRDFTYLLDKIQDEKKYKKIFLVGFSMGGNIILKYLGESGRANKDSTIAGAATFSVPLDLACASIALAKGFNRLYSKHFMLTLTKKVDHIRKNHKVPALDKLKLRSLNTFIDFDEHVTAPLNGYKNARDYWRQASSKLYLKDIKVPALVVNAKNDPFLGDKCYPVKDEIGNELVELLYPEFGGHVGFIDKGLNDNTWMETKAYEFIMCQL